MVLEKGCALYQNGASSSRVQVKVFTSVMLIFKRWILMKSLLYCVL